MNKPNLAESQKTLLNASCKAFLKKNSVAPNELIEKGNTFIKVDSSFMNQANWINSSYVYQIRKEY